MRSVPEWVGKHDDQAIPPRVRLRIFEKHKGICYLSGRKIRPGDQWQADHIKALCNGGEHREGNLAPVLADPHKHKTATDRKEKARADARRKGFVGVTKPKRKMGYRLFDNTPVRPE